MGDWSANSQDPDYEDWKSGRLDENDPNPTPQPAVIAPRQAPPAPSSPSGSQPVADTEEPDNPQPVKPLPAPSDVAETISSDNAEETPAAERSITPRAGRVGKVQAAAMTADDDSKPDESYSDWEQTRKEQGEQGLLGPIRPRYSDARLEQAQTERDVAGADAAATALAQQRANEQNEQRARDLEQQRAEAAAQRESDAKARDYFEAARDQGYQVEHDPGGGLRIATNEDGTPKWQAKAMEPHQDENGEWVQDYRDESGTVKRGKLLENGDYHTDPVTGEQWINLKGFRQRIGVDGNVVKINQFKQQQDDLALADAQQEAVLQQKKIDLVPLRDQLRQATISLKANKAARDFEDARVKYAPGGSSADPTIWDQYQKEHADFLARFGPIQQKVQQQEEAIRTLESQRLNNALQKAKILSNIREFQLARAGRLTTGAGADGAAADGVGGGEASPTGLPAWLSRPGSSPAASAPGADRGQDQSQAGQAGTSSQGQGVGDSTPAGEEGQAQGGDSASEDTTPAGENGNAISAIPGVEGVKQAMDAPPQTGQTGKTLQPGLNLDDAAARAARETQSGIPQRNPQAEHAKKATAVVNMLEFLSQDPGNEDKFNQLLDKSHASGALDTEQAAEVARWRQEQLNPKDNKVGGIKDATNRFWDTTMAGMERGTAGLLRWAHVPGADSLDKTAEEHEEDLTGKAMKQLPWSKEATPGVNPSLQDTPGAKTAELGGAVAQTLPAMIATEGVGEVAALPRLAKLFNALRVGTLAPRIAGVIPLGLQMAAQASDSARAQALKVNPGDVKAADAAGAQAAWETVPQLGVYSLTGGAASTGMRALTRVAPVMRSPFAQLLGNFATNTAGNMGASMVLRKAEGKNPLDVGESAGQDVAWGIVGAKHGYDAAKYVSTAQALATGEHPELQILRSMQGSSKLPDRVKAQAKQQADNLQAGAKGFLKQMGMPEQSPRQQADAYTAALQRRQEIQDDLSVPVKSLDEVKAGAAQELTGLKEKEQSPTGVSPQEQQRMDFLETHAEKPEAIAAKDGIKTARQFTPDDLSAADDHLHRLADNVVPPNPEQAVAAFKAVGIEADPQKVLDAITENPVLARAAVMVGDQVREMLPNAKGAEGALEQKGQPRSINRVRTNQLLGAHALLDALPKVAEGKQIDDRVGQILTRNGLVTRAETQNPDGTTGVRYKMTENGIPLLPKGHREAVGAHPDKFNVYISPNGAAAPVTAALEDAGEARIRQAIGTLKEHPNETSPPDHVSVTPEDARKLFVESLLRYMPSLKKLGLNGATPVPSDHKLVVNSGGMAMAPDRLYVSFEKLADQLGGKMVEGKTSRDLMDEMINEEVVHKLGLDVVKREEAEEIAQTASAGIVRAARKLYNGFDALTDFQKGHEILRMYLTGKYQGRMTEAIYKAVTRVVNYLRGRFDQLPADSPLKKYGAKVEARAQELGIDLSKPSSEDSQGGEHERTNGDVQDEEGKAPPKESSGADQVGGPSSLQSKEQESEEGVQGLAAAKKAQEQHDLKVAVAKAHETALGQREGFLRETARAAGRSGMRWANEHAGKAVKKLPAALAKLDRKPAVPSDLLRTTVVSGAKSPDAVRNQTLKFVQNMAREGYQLYAPGGMPDVTDRHASESTGYRDIALKFVKDVPGKGDPVVKEVLVLQPAMLRAKPGIHGFYDMARAVDARIKNDVTLSGDEIKYLDGLKKWADSRIAKVGQRAYLSDNPGAGSGATEEEAQRLASSQSSEDISRSVSPRASISSSTSPRTESILSDNLSSGSSLISNPALRSLATSDLRSASERVFALMHPDTTEKPAGSKPESGGERESGNREIGKEEPLQAAAITKRDRGSAINEGATDHEQDSTENTHTAERGTKEEETDGRAGGSAENAHERGGADHATAADAGDGRGGAGGAVGTSRDRVGAPAKSIAELITDNIGLAHSIAADYRIPGVDPEEQAKDTAAEARVGLGKAARGFETERGIPFASYAGRVIRNHLNDVFGREKRRASNESVTLDDMVPGIEDTSHKDNVADISTAGPASGMEHTETAAAVREELERLPEKVRAVMEARMEGRSQEEIGNDKAIFPQGTTKQNVSKIEVQARGLMLARLREKGFSGVDEDGVLYAAARAGNSERVKEIERVEDHPYSKNSTHILINDPLAGRVMDFAKSIPDSDIYEGDGAAKFGREDEPHVTSLYGLTTPTAEDVAAKLGRVGPVKATLGKLSVFKNEKYDVLKADVDSPDLHRINGQLREMPHENDYPVYHPHMTVAYLKPGKGQKYAGDARFEGLPVSADHLIFSGKDGVKKAIALSDAGVDSLAAATKEVDRVRDLIDAHRSGARLPMKPADSVIPKEDADRATTDTITSAESRLAKALGVVKAPGKAEPEHADLLKRLEALEPKISKKDQVREWASGVAAWGKRLLHEVSHLPNFDVWKRTVNKLVADRQQSAKEVGDMMRQIIRAVPDKLTREAITNYRVAGGNAAKLRMWADLSKDGKLKAAYEKALNLTDEQKGLARAIDEYYKGKLALGQARGMLASGLENYASQIWRDENGKPVKAMPGGKFKQNFNFANPRSFDDFFTGESLGFKPLTKDAASLLGIYGSEFNHVLADRDFIRALSKAKAPDGRPIITSGLEKVLRSVREGETADLVSGAFHIGKVEDPDGYKSLDENPVLQRWKFTRPMDAEGKDSTADSQEEMPLGDEPGPAAPKIVSRLYAGNLLVHPDYARRMNAVIGESGLKKWIREPGETAATEAFKMAARGIGRLNKEAKGLTFSLSPFHIIHVAKRAAGQRINPFTNLQAVDFDDPLVRRAAEHGAMFYGDDAGQALFLEGLGSGKGTIAGKLPIAKELSHWTFHEYIPRLKLKSYTAMLERKIGEFKGDLESGKVSIDQLENKTAQEVNSLYGHMNYAEMGRQPIVQHLMSLGLMAPDFLEGTLRFYGDVAKGLNPLGHTGREALKGIATLALGTMAAAKILNYLVDPNGDPHWDHPFSVVHNGREYSLRSPVMDLQNLYYDWRRFTSGRLSPLVGHLWQFASGKNYRGEPMTLTDQARDLIASFIPASIRALPGANQISPVDSHNDVKAWEKFASTMGVKIARWSPSKDINAAAEKFLESKGKNNPNTPFAESKYKMLRQALQDGDMPEAKTEYQKLVKTAKEDLLRKARAGALRGIPDPAGEVERGLRSSIFHPVIADQAMQKEFLNQLSPHEKELFRQSIQERVKSWNLFQHMSGSLLPPKLPQFMPPTAPEPEDEPSDQDGPPSAFNVPARRLLAGERVNA